MTEEQILLVKNSWKIFRTMNAAFIGDVFYCKLFFDSPKLRKMFPESMDEQYGKLIDMVSVIVTRLDNLNAITEDIKAMAERHTGYGVKPEHYKLAGNALLWTLEKGLGNEWNGKLKEAWTLCYNMIADIMIDVTENKTV